MHSQNIPLKEIETKIYLIRGRKVMLDSDLAELYGVETKYLNKAVKRNIRRFPADFMFQLSEEEREILRCQFGTSKRGRGGRMYNPFAFTQEGIAIMRTFVGLRVIVTENKTLAEKLTRLEQKYDRQFKVIFDAIREIMSAHSVPRRRIIGLGESQK